jgi:amylovoran biosynthesis glycosyltransferase AmsD
MKNISIYIQNILHPAGTERAVINLANNLYLNGYNVDIISLYSSNGFPFFSLLTEINVKHLKLKEYDSVLKKTIYLPFVIYKLFISVQKKNKIIIGTAHSINIFLSITKYFKGENKYIGCEHIDYDAAKGLTKLFRKYCYPFLDYIVVLTQNDLNKYLFFDKLKNCKIIPNEISFYPNKSPIYTNKIMLAIGRFTNQKGFDLLIDAIKDVLYTNLDWRLFIVGDGEMKLTLEKKIKLYNLENQIVLKPFTNNIENYFLNSSIYLMTSRYEGLPMVLLEAKACGLPIISYDCPSGPKEIIMNNEDGFLIPFADVEKFQQKLKLLLNDVEKRIKMGTLAKINSQYYSSKNIYLKWLNLFNNL